MVELKAVDTIHPIHRAQVISCLKAIGLPLGLLLNFKVVAPKADIERIALSR